MAINTYDALDKVTVATATPSITFSSIPSTYTDLVIVASFKAASTTIVTPSIRFNGDTNTNYSNTSMYSNASTVTSYNWANTNKGYLGDFYAGVSSNAFIPYIIHINNYSNSSTYKTVLCRYNQINSSNAEIGETVAMWRNTSAISSVTLTSDGGQNFAVGSTFSLYGIKAWANTEASPKATGGYVYSDSSYWYHAFPFSSTFTPNQSLTADILVIAGGGAGGTAGERGAGGGGAGGLLAHTSQSLTATNYSITVGAGGTAGAGGGSYLRGSNGSNSQFASLTASVGGGAAGTENSTLHNGVSGGSGGGGGASTNSGTGGSATSSQGYAGGNGYGINSISASGGGGGGAGAAGANAGSGNPTAGGNGLSTYSAWGIATQTGEIINGTVYYAGGGAGAGGGVGRSGGYGGGGNSSASSTPGTNGKVLTGGGGGGNSLNATPGSGGSGVVIVRYAK